MPKSFVSENNATALMQGIAEKFKRAVKVDEVTCYYDDDNVLHARVWAGTLARYYVEKDKIPPDTEIILTDYDGIPPVSYPDDYYVNGVKIVPWSTGSDADVKAMLAGADAGKINIHEYWQIGDIRTQHMDAIAANPNGAFVDGVAEGDVKLALMNKGYMGQSGIHFAVGQADGSHGFARMNTTYTNVGSWRDSAMRADLNNLYFNAFGETFRSCFKPFTVTTIEEYRGTELQTTTDYLALFAEKEVFGEGWKYSESDTKHKLSNDTEANALSQIEYFKIDKSHIYHTSTNTDKSESSWLWWLRSPSTEEGPNYFCVTMASGRTVNGIANNSNSAGIVPFFCI